MPGLLTLFLAIASAEATDVAMAAEAVRLRGEMELHSERSVWNGVEGAYNNLVDLGVATWADHLRAAEASRMQGEMHEAVERYDLAIAAGAGDQAAAPRAMILATFADTTIVVSRRHLGARTLTTEDMPLERDGRAVIERAQSELAEEWTYTGVLPLGRYSVDGHSFEIVGGPHVRVVVTPRGAKVREEPLEPNG